MHRWRRARPSHAGQRSTARCLPRWLDQTFLLHSRAGRRAHHLPQLQGRHAGRHGLEQQRHHQRAALRPGRHPLHVLHRRAAAHPVHLAARGRGLRAVRRQRHHRAAEPRAADRSNAAPTRVRHHGADHQAAPASTAAAAAAWPTSACSTTSASSTSPRWCSTTSWAAATRSTSPRPSRTRPATTWGCSTTATRRRLLPGPRQRRHRLGADHGRGLLPGAGAVEQGRVQRCQQRAGRLRGDGQQRPAAARRRPRQHHRQRHRCSGSTSGGVVTLYTEGVVERPIDVDWFSFAGGAGTSRSPWPGRTLAQPGRAGRAATAAGKLLASANPADALPAAISHVAALPGTYFAVSVQGVGKGDPDNRLTATTAAWASTRSPAACRLRPASRRRPRPARARPAAPCR
jgi:hypothetical protein